MLIRTDTLQPWDKKRLASGILHPRNIEQLWSDADLLEIGLVKRIPFVTPEGWRAIGGPTYDITGQETYQIELIPLPTAEEIAAEKVSDIDRVFNSYAITKLLFSLGKEQGMFNDLAGMRAWVDAKADPQ